MNIEQFYEFCLAKKGVTEHFPFDKDTLVFKVGGKIFALTSLSKWESGHPSVNLKCDPEYAIALREQYESVKPGYHTSKVHWNTIMLNREVSDKLVCQLISDSYNLIFNNLTKKIQQEIIKLEN